MFSFLSIFILPFACIALTGATPEFHPQNFGNLKHFQVLSLYTGLFQEREKKEGIVLSF